MAEQNTERLFIRPYGTDDEKQVRFIIGQAQMEVLAFVNHRVNFNPISIAVWIASSAVFAQLMGWWPPDPKHGWFGYVAIFPAFFVCAVPIMLFVDWKNRPSVETRSERTLRQADMLDISAYYARSPASGCWVLQYGEKIIGLIALDASSDATNDKPLDKNVKLSAQELKALIQAKGTSPIATIRHFFSEEPYRPAGIEDDLLGQAVRHAFTSDKKLQSIRISVATIRQTLLDSLKKIGFVPGEEDGKLGPFGWSWKWYSLERTTWERRSSAQGSD